ncbi:hypothetical protein J6590_056212 [Homalodisca vitripennis]|nr:hypothetical protein J6590_056212 [Homalodisca vitripennis]
MGIREKARRAVWTEDCVIRTRYAACVCVCVVCVCVRGQQPGSVASARRVRLLRLTPDCRAERARALTSVHTYSSGGMRSHHSTNTPHPILPLPSCISHQEFERHSEGMCLKRRPPGMQRATADARFIHGPVPVLSSIPSYSTQCHEF